VQEYYTAQLCHRAESQSDRKTIIRSNHDENKYRWRQMKNEQYIEMSVNGVSMICGLVSTVIHK